MDPFVEKENQIPLITKNDKKRKQHTPITPSLAKTVIRRKVEAPKLTFANDDMRKLSYNKWLLEQEMKKNDELMKFAELEEKFKS
ncbi:hypothetical protein CLIB1444_04S05666 [[Candida] jaroonii]|uniref:Uncharacterized protein n=1 Tax=[Candida] jaroonii TaxID=467808 RepID=A0ACA9Y6X9_9ASCO|nr:hypothetical protein CLIB1444_04S05666 [[Candida] jaroonii]